MEKRCLECGAVLYGRQDKVFCNELCKNAFHNRRAFRQRADMRRTNDILSRNHMILKALCDEGVRGLSFSDLKDIGFDRHFQTSCIRSGPFWSEHRCYNYSYRLNHLTRRLTRLKRIAIFARNR